MKTKKNIIINGVFLIVHLILITLNLLSGYNSIFLIFLSLLWIVENIIFIIRNSYSFIAFLSSLFIAYANYSIAIAVYLDKSLLPSLYSQIESNKIYGIALISMSIFSLILLFSNTGLRQKKDFSWCENNESNILIEMICFFAYLIIFLTQTSWSLGSRMSFTALGEYRYVFVLFGGLYHSKNKFSKISWTFLISLTTIISILGGSRVDALPSLFLLLFLWYPKLNVKKIVILIPIGILVLKISGSLRGKAFTTDSIGNAFVSLFSDKFYSDTFPYAYLPSLLSIQMGLTQTLSFKFDLLLKNITYIFAGGNYSKYLLSAYTREFYAHSYGMIAPISLNYWFGFAGPIIVGILTLVGFNGISSLFTKRKKNNLIKTIILVFAASLPRWYVYNLFQLPRAIIFTLILYFAFDFINKMTLAKNSDYKLEINYGKN